MTAINRRQMIHAGTVLAIAPQPVLSGPAGDPGPPAAVTAGEQLVTSEDRTYYVNPSSGIDTNDGSGTRPFRTIQHAINQLPPLIMHRITIQLADGIYDSSELTAADMARPAIVWITGKLIRGRSDSASGGTHTSGYLLIKGTTKGGTIIATTAAYTHGVYATHAGDVALDELTIRRGAGTAGQLLTAHRTGTYLQCSNVDVDGQGNTSDGVVAEAGGWIEMTGNSDIRGCTTNVTSFAGSGVVLANSVNVGAGGTGVAGAGYVLLASGPAAKTIGSPISMANGTLQITGYSAVCPVNVSGALSCFNTRIYALYGNLSGDIALHNCDTVLNNTNWSAQMRLFGGSIERINAHSFILSASASTVAIPLVLLNDASHTKDSASSIKGSAGLTSVSYNPPALSIDTDGATVAFCRSGRMTVQYLTGNGSDRTRCILGTMDTSYGGPPADGDLWTIINTGTDAVALIDSTTSDIATGGISLGTGTGQTQSITLSWRASAARWVEAGRGGVS